MWSREIYDQKSWQWAVQFWKQILYWIQIIYLPHCVWALVIFKGDVTFMHSETFFPKVASRWYPTQDLKDLLRIMVFGYGV